MDLLVSTLQPTELYNISNFDLSNQKGDLWERFRRSLIRNEKQSIIIRY
jgi:hypothetical protein